MRLRQVDNACDVSKSRASVIGSGGQSSFEETCDTSEPLDQGVQGSRAWAASELHPQDYCALRGGAVPGAIQARCVAHHQRTPERSRYKKWLREQGLSLRCETSPVAQASLYTPPPHRNTGWLHYLVAREHAACSGRSALAASLLPRLDSVLVSDGEHGRGRHAAVLLATELGIATVAPVRRPLILHEPVGLTCVHHICRHSLLRRWGS